MKTTNLQSKTKNRCENHSSQRMLLKNIIYNHNGTTARVLPNGAKTFKNVSS